jgi:hypothetical protein
MLEAMLIKGMLATQDMWYIEMAGGGAPHTFDLRITVKRGPGIGRLAPRRFLDDEGDPVDVDHVVSVNRAGSALEVKGIQIAGSLALAFEADIPEETPLTFDLRIDGRSVPAKVAIGESCESPGQMPFSAVAQDAAAASRSGPPQRPQGPGFLVWHSKSEFRGKTQAELEDDTLKELRALGYIQ